MTSKYTVFDRTRLRLRPLAERVHDMDLGYVLPLDGKSPPFDHPDLPAIASALRDARERDATRLWMMGAHVIKMGASRHIIDLLRKGWISHLAMNGACTIHDYELARIGATTESVARYIRSGEFGLWEETGLINEWACEAADAGLGLGEYIGKRISESDYSHRDVSILAAAYEASVPVSVHVGVGYDITHEHPNCNGAALGETSYRDFLMYTHAVENLEGGAMLSFGSAIMGPEVYLKALSMARNVAHQEGRQIADFTTAVFDLIPIEGDYQKELPKTDPGYYFRPHKTILVRTVADGGRSHYVCGDHRAVIPALRRVLMGGASR
jgi:hypothetical protein